MDDLNSTLGAILNDPEKMAQLRAVAESLGMNPGGNPPASSQPAQQPAGSNSTDSPSSEHNEDAASSETNEDTGDAQTTQTAQTSTNTNPDSGEHAGTNSGQTNSNSNTNGNTNGNNRIDPASIASILQNFQNAGGGNNGNAETSSGNSSMDPGAVAKITQVLSAFNNKNDKNVELMRSLKPHFSAARASRVDDAIRIMQVLRAWPALRDSGLLGNLNNLFGGGRR